jgi:hypothetical protein
MNEQELAEHDPHAKQRRVLQKQLKRATSIAVHLRMEATKKSAMAAELAGTTRAAAVCQAGTMRRRALIWERKAKRLAQQIERLGGK